ncbi:Insulin-like growth factor binding protein, N-terminal [Pseudocohnilembus persalinus]|uniref:Insulin-like growth factor binding protein, N-terminal n=1 Tax=Pseudocohnilembus persalinus TaxID=266149 RepID=A0A0V0R1B2_PSEPJ|nr:Insulin-like growth factor binding protein, N-terminal [Pseudocohnilembus persalinus]|eukprot:KRX08308.1 Insulin-like growth factor binding protein, N-terminal [Pseudocohnilembus persalinus]
MGNNQIRYDQLDVNRVNKEKDSVQYLDDISDEFEKEQVLIGLKKNQLYKEMKLTRDACDDNILYYYLLKRIDYEQNIEKIILNGQFVCKNEKKQFFIQNIQFITIQTANKIGYITKNHQFKHLWTGWGNKSQLNSHQMLMNSKNRFDLHSGEHISKTISQNKTRPIRWYYLENNFQWTAPLGSEFVERSYINNQKNPKKGSAGIQITERYEFFNKQSVYKLPRQFQKNCHFSCKSCLTSAYNDCFQCNSGFILNNITQYSLDYLPLRTYEYTETVKISIGQCYCSGQSTQNDQNNRFISLLTNALFQKNDEILYRRRLWLIEKLYKLD